MPKCAYCQKEIDEKDAIKFESGTKVLYFCCEEHLEYYLGKKTRKLMLVSIFSLSPFLRCEVSRKKFPGGYRIAAL